jgi:hypothetical protein
MHAAPQRLPIVKIPKRLGIHFHCIIFLLRPTFGDWAKITWTVRAFAKRIFLLGKCLFIYIVSFCRLTGAQDNGKQKESLSTKEKLMLQWLHTDK